MLQPLLLSTDEAAVVLGIKRTTLFRLLAEDKLPSVLIGRRRLVPRDSLEQYVESLMPQRAA